MILNFFVIFIPAVTLSQGYYRRKQYPSYKTTSFGYIDDGNQVCRREGVYEVTSGYGKGDNHIEEVHSSSHDVKYTHGKSCYPQVTYSSKSRVYKSNSDRSNNVNVYNTRKYYGKTARSGKDGNEEECEIKHEVSSSSSSATVHSFPEIPEFPKFPKIESKRPKKLDLPSWW